MKKLWEGKEIWRVERVLGYDAFAVVYWNEKDGKISVVEETPEGKQLGSYVNFDTGFKESQEARHKANMIAADNMKRASDNHQMVTALERKLQGAISLISHTVSTVRRWANPNSFMGKEMEELGNKNSEFLANNPHEFNLHLKQFEEQKSPCPIVKK